MNTLLMMQSIVHSRYIGARTSLPSSLVLIPPDLSTSTFGANPGGANAVLTLLRQGFFTSCDRGRALETPLYNVKTANDTGTKITQDK